MQRKMKIMVGKSDLFGSYYIFYSSDYFQVSGKVLSNDLAEMFERFVSKSSDLQVFLDRYCRELGVDTATAKHYHALFDRM